MAPRLRDILAEILSSIPELRVGTLASLGTGREWEWDWEDVVMVELGSGGRKWGLRDVREEALNALLWSAARLLINLW